MRSVPVPLPRDRPVQLLPHQAISPLPWADGCPVLVADLPHLLGDVLVGGHDPEDLRCRQRALRVHVAPPVDGLDAALQAQSPVLPEHGPEPGVRALDGVVG